MTLQEAEEILDNWAADDPLAALREIAHLLSPFRVDMCAIAEPSAALVHAWDRLTPARRAYCIAAARADDLTRYVPDRLAPERRKAIEAARGFAIQMPHWIAPERVEPIPGTKVAPRTCNACGGPLPGRRPEQQWCSSACRQRGYRQRRAAP